MLPKIQNGLDKVSLATLFSKSIPIKLNKTINQINS
jgi:hypothetical protein